MWKPRSHVAVSAQDAENVELELQQVLLRKDFERHKLCRLFLREKMGYS